MIPGAYSGLFAIFAVDDNAVPTAFLFHCLLAVFLCRYNLTGPFGADYVFPSVLKDRVPI